MTIRFEWKPTLDLALNLHPDTTRVVVVAGDSDFDKLSVAEAREQFSEERRIEFTYLTGLGVEELQQQLAHLPEHTIVIHASYTRDPAGNYYTVAEGISLIAPYSVAPVYGVWEPVLGEGIVGGKLVSMDRLAARTAEIGLRILGGEKPGTISPEILPGTPMFDWRQLQKWGIAENKLPNGSVVDFRTPSAWEQYRGYIASGLALIIFESMLIAWLLVLRSRRRQAELRSEGFAARVVLEHKRLDEVVSNVPGVVWESRFEPGTGVRKAEFVSPYVERLLGYTVEEWLSKPDFVSSITHEEDRKRIAVESEAIIASGKEGVLQCRWLAKNGDLLWVEAHLAAVCDEHGKTIGLRGVTMNITDRRQAEVALKENQAQLAGVIGSAMDAIISIDERQRIVLFNAAAEEMFGCSVTEAMGQPLNRFIPTPLRDAHLDSVPKQKNGAGLYAGSFASLTARRAAGEDFAIDVSISEVELNGARFYTLILRDITERLRAEEALRERKQELSEAQRVAKVGSWEWDPATDTVTWSEEMFRIKGRDPALLAPRYQENPSHYTPASWQRLKTAVERALADGTPYELELEMIRTDGQLAWVNARGEVLRDAQGKIIKLRGTCQDIAERKKAEAALQKAVEEVSQLKNKLEEENIYLREEINLAHSFDEIIGRSDATTYVL